MSYIDNPGTSGAGSGTVTSVAGGVGITNVPEPITTAGTVNLDIFSLTTGVAFAVGDWLPFVDVSVGTTPASQRKLTIADLVSGVNPLLDHGALLGLGDDDHTQYALLAGRAGGQILHGGVNSFDPLALHSNTFDDGLVTIGAANNITINDALNITNIFGARLLVGCQAFFGSGIFGGTSSGDDLTIHSNLVDDGFVSIPSPEFYINGLFYTWPGVSAAGVLVNDGADNLSWSASVALDHGALTGLLDDDHTQYALLAGRTGGQLLYGGGSGDDLQLRSNTSNNGNILIGGTGAPGSPALLVSTPLALVVCAGQFQALTTTPGANITGGDVATYPAGNLFLWSNPGQTGLIKLGDGFTLDETANTITTTFPWHAVAQIYAELFISGGIASGDNLNLVSNDNNDGLITLGSLVTIDQSASTFAFSGAGSVTLTSFAGEIKFDAAAAKVNIPNAAFSINGLNYLWPASSPANTVLTNDGADNLSWATPATGTVTSIAGGVGITNSPEPITTTGTVDLDINSLTTETVVATGDLLAMVDVSVGVTIAAQRKITVGSLATGLNGLLDHGVLLGLTPDDDHPQYFLLAGRAGGQTANGGTAASENLTLLSTAHATKGSISFDTNLIATASMTDPAGGARTVLGYTQTLAITGASNTIHVYDASPTWTLSNGTPGEFAWFFAGGTVTATVNNALSIIFPNYELITSTSTTNAVMPHPTHAYWAGNTHTLDGAITASGTQAIPSYTSFTTIQAINGASATYSGTSALEGLRCNEFFKATGNSAALSYRRIGVRVMDLGYTTSGTPRGTIAVEYNVGVLLEDMVTTAEAATVTVSEVTGIKSAITSGTNKYFLRDTGGAQNVLGGTVSIGSLLTASVSTTETTTVIASTRTINGASPTLSMLSITPTCSSQGGGSINTLVGTVYAPAFTNDGGLITTAGGYQHGGSYFSGGAAGRVPAATTGYLEAPTFTHGTAFAAGTTSHVGYKCQTLIQTTLDNASTTLTCSETGYNWAPSFTETGASTLTISSAIAYTVNNPGITGTPAITITGGLDIADLTRGTTNFSLRSAGAAVEMRHLGPGVFGANAAPTNASCVLEVQSTTKAFIPSRMTTTQRDAIATATDGMILYNSTKKTHDVRRDSQWVEVPGWNIQISKPADQTVTNTTTLQDDTDLQFAVLTDEVWLVELLLGMNANNTTSDMKWGFTASGASFVIAQSNWDAVYYANTVLTNAAPAAFASTTEAVTGGTAGPNGDGTNYVTYARYRFRASAGATVKVQFALNASAAGGRNAVMKAGSMLRAKKLSAI